MKLLDAPRCRALLDGRRRTRCLLRSKGASSTCTSTGPAAPGHIQPMIVIAGGDVVLPDRILTSASLVIDGDRIAAIEPRRASIVRAPRSSTAADCYVVPGFIDVHVHGVEGHDTLNDGDPVAAIAAMLPRYGVTRSVRRPWRVRPTRSAACSNRWRTLRATRPPRARACCRRTSKAISSTRSTAARSPPTACACPIRRTAAPVRTRATFLRRDILDVIAGSRPDVGIVTLAPELPGGLDLVRALVAAGHRVSLGHSGASLEEAMAAIEPGARHATHLFNRMAPMTHRAPGVAGRGPCARGSGRRVDLRRLPRAPGDEPHRDRGEGRRPDHGDHRWHRRVRPRGWRDRHARRAPHSRHRPGGGPGRRDAGGQHADDGSRVQDDRDGVRLLGRRGGGACARRRRRASWGWQASACSPKARSRTSSMLDRQFGVVADVHRRRGGLRTRTDHNRSGSASLPR